MTVRDWLQLLIVPFALVLISFLFTVQQDRRQLQTENQRAEADRELAQQRAQDEALQAYLDQMSQLMLDRKLLEAEQGDPVYTLAQARTSTVMVRLDAERRRSMIRFLSDSGLTGTGESSISLFREIDLSEANLNNANLSRANLTYANLSGATLRNANLSYAVLIGADLEGATGITNEQLYQQGKSFAKSFEGATTLEGATMPNGQKYEDWLKDRAEHGENP